MTETGGNPRDMTMPAPCGLSHRIHIVLIVATVLLALLVLFHVPYVNGPSHWQWEWRRLPAVRWYGAVLVGALPVLIHVRNERRVVVPLALLMLGSLTLKLASAAAIDPPTGMNFIADVVRSPISTSYFIDAGVLSNYPGWFAAYDEVLPRTGLHTRSKPPGPLLYWSGFIQTLGYTREAAIVGGIALGVLAMLSIPATWWLVRLLTADRDSAMFAAATLALCPGFELFFPMFDPAYITLACAMIGLWHLTVARESDLLAVSLGLTLVAVTMVAYPLLSLGLFMLLEGLLLATMRPPRQSILVTLRHGVVAVLVAVSVYLALWFFTAYDPIATFKSAWANQYRFLAQHEGDRRWPATVPWDLLDFALGAGWLPVLVAVLFVSRSGRRDHRLLAVLCVAQPLVVALTGLVQSETARVWNYMLPLLLLPAALELRAWTSRERLTFFACLWILLAVIGQNMTFINPGLDEPPPATTPSASPR